MRTDHEDDNEQRTSGSVSRRRFIASAGMVVAGGALAGTALAAAELGKAKEPAPTAPAALPWPWPKLDPMEAGKRAFQYYHLKGGWGSGAWLGVLSLLKEKVGAPYTNLPDDIFHHAAGGYGDQGTLCGSIGACASIINLAAYDDKKTHAKLIGDLMDWYSKAVLPGERFDEIATYKKQLNKVPNSPLCHVSVSTWMNAAKVSYSDKSRKDRCAKVTAETVYRTVEILNQHVDSKYKIVGPKPSAQTETCLTCHGPKAADNGKGFMECLTCHDDHTK